MTVEERVMTNITIEKKDTMHNSNIIVIITIEKRHISHARATEQDHLGINVAPVFNHSC